MIKLTNLLIEIEQERREQYLEEGWKENIMAAAIAAASLFGGGAKGKARIGTGPGQGIEQTTTNQGAPLNINFGTAFSSGRYLIKGNTQNILIDKLEEIGEYIAKNPAADYKIEIISSESQVPNYDAEKPGRVRLNMGELAEKRATVLNAAVKEFTNVLKQKDILQGNVDIKISPILVGKEKFTSGVDNKDDNKYTKDQFVKLVITAIPKSTNGYSKYSNRGEIIFMNNKAHAVAFYPSSTTISKSKEGGLNTAYQDILLKTIDRVGLEGAGKSINPNINTPGQYVTTYKIPWSEWNKTAGVTNTVTQDMMGGWEQYKVTD
jgi:hypothetical protein